MAQILSLKFYKLLLYLVLDWELIFESNKVVNKIYVVGFNQPYSRILM